MRITTKNTYVSRETGEELTAEQVKQKYNKIKYTKVIKQLGWCTQINYIWECDINNQLHLKL